jgi:hypothetical protein
MTIDLLSPRITPTHAGVLLGGAPLFLEGDDHVEC